MGGLEPVAATRHVRARRGRSTQPVRVHRGPPTSGDGWVAAAAFLASAALAGAIAWRNTTEGVFSGELAAPGRSREPSPTHPLERVAFGWIAFGSLLIAVGFAQRALGIDAPDTGWAYAVIGVAASAAMVVATRHAAALLWAALPALLLTTYVSLQPIGQFAGHDAVLLGVPTVHALVAFALLRRWSLAVTGVALGMLAPAALWESQAWQWWQLAGGLRGHLRRALRRAHAAPPLRGARG